MVRAIVGANWGDEGKGKITDMLAKESDIIIRFQGGSNAGHTIINDYGKFALHLLPSGVFYQHTTSIIGNGVALNIPYLVQEIESLVERGVPKPRILVSDRAQILMPYHVLFDTYEEARLAGKSFVLAPGRQITIVPDRIHDRPAILVADGGDGIALIRGDHIRIRRSENYTLLADTGIRSFYETAFAKLTDRL